MKYKLIAFLLLFTTYNFANSVNTGHADVSLIKFSGNNSQANEFFIGIKMDMQKNWHTYWKNPGDSGGPIKVSWNLPDGVTISDIYWPTPKLIPYSPLMTYGYKDFVIFPFKITYQDSNQLKKISANIDFLICDDISSYGKGSEKGLFYFKNCLYATLPDSLWNSYLSELKCLSRLPNSLSLTCSPISTLPKSAP